MIFTLVFLKSWVMKLVSLPMYVEVAHLGVGVCVCVLEGGFFCCCWGLGVVLAGGMGSHCCIGCFG